MEQRLSLKQQSMNLCKVNAPQYGRGDETQCLCVGTVHHAILTLKYCSTTLSSAFQLNINERNL